tara:strand:- start:8111 stop:8251 length:141 start_codon:yes stop_codon:yes gene_type:complete
MAKIKDSASTTLIKTKKKRQGVHSKKKHSSLKTSKNYKKTYRAQGK